MYLAHSGAALAATAADRRVPVLWLLVAAWAFDLTGVGHWLPVAVVLAVLAFEVGRRRWDARAGAVLAGLVVSHDVLDLVVGVQLLPGGRFIGWDLGPGSIVALVLELGILAAGAAVYLSTLPSGGRRRPLVLLALGCVLAVSLAEWGLNRWEDDDSPPGTLAALALGAIVTSVLLVRADRQASPVAPS